MKELPQPLLGASIETRMGGGSVEDSNVVTGSCWGRFRGLFQIENSESGEAGMKLSIEKVEDKKGTYYSITEINEQGEQTMNGDGDPYRVIIENMIGGGIEVTRGSTNTLLKKDQDLRVRVGSQVFDIVANDKKAVKLNGERVA